MKRQDVLVYVLLLGCLLFIGLLLMTRRNGEKSRMRQTVTSVPAQSEGMGGESSRGDPDSERMWRAIQEKSRLTDRQRDANDPVRNSYEQQWYRETEAATRERLARPPEPQSIYGRVAFKALYDQINPREPMIVYAAIEGQAPVSSLILDGAYSLGVLPAGTIQLHLKQTSRTPAVWVHDVRIQEGQAALEYVWELGDATAVVKVYGVDNAPLQSEDVELLLGGISSRLHTWKTATGIQNGVWRVDYLLPDTYIVRAKWKGRVAGEMVALASGENTVELRLRGVRKTDE
jgi:hypothetical protein